MKLTDNIEENVEMVGLKMSFHVVSLPDVNIVVMVTTAFSQLSECLVDSVDMVLVLLVMRMNFLVDLTLETILIYICRLLKETV
jgi:hypothetical protein